MEERINRRLAMVVLACLVLQGCSFLAVIPVCRSYDVEQPFEFSGRFDAVVNDFNEDAVVPAAARELLEFDLAPKSVSAGSYRAVGTAQMAGHVYDAEIVVSAGECQGYDESAMAVQSLPPEPETVYGKLTPSDGGESWHLTHTSDRGSLRSGEESYSLWVPNLSYGPRTAPHMEIHDVQATRSTDRHAPGDDVMWHVTLTAGEALDVRIHVIGDDGAMSVFEHRVVWDCQPCTVDVGRYFPEMAESVAYVVELRDTHLHHYSLVTPAAGVLTVPPLSMR